MHWASAFAINHSIQNYESGEGCCPPLSIGVMCTCARWVAPIAVAGQSADGADLNRVVRCRLASDDDRLRVVEQPGANPGTRRSGRRNHRTPDFVAPCFGNRTDLHHELSRWTVVHAQYCGFVQDGLRPLAVAQGETAGDENRDVVVAV